ncbi:CheY-like chemotaxis protein/signal transduction histidine kinase [Pelomonas saccharophila]|uniref:histidine kinase n=1 Tax=Roseateles saccharophilus TaxID=304 RepID=A0ABU1YK43_ROSSA|nr:response regulator [Roseateles saccharophilus]MDR7269227.1 CheY-like chemotaxis protein/signal transduction histidine kinase [Roseateles saccharophilus]
MMNATTTGPRLAPARPSPRAIWRPAAATARTPAERACLIHLLVVDDDVAVIEYLGQLLKGFAQVSFATNGEDALRLAELHRPDLVLLDVDLPGLGGFEVCRRLRATPGLADLPIIFATSHADPGTEAEALQLGANDFLHKPFDDVQVLARLRTQLRAAANERPDRPEASGPGRTRILIIDDDATSIQLVRSLLADVGECHFALNGAQALTLVGELRPDLILLDVDLPDSDGFRVCKQLRADPEFGQVPIMFLTSSSTIGHEARALALGGDDFVRKPFSAPVLCARVRRLVDRKRSLERYLDQVDHRHRQISDGRVAAVVEACKDAIVVADTQGRIVMANAAACTLLGLTAEALDRARLAELLVSDADGHDCVRLSSGQRIPVEVSTSTEGLGADALTLHVLRDTRERDQALATARRQTEAAAARRATASMLSYIAHEIGNPVNVIKGFAQLMQAERMSASQVDKLAHILDAVGRLSGLLADVTDVARMESGQFHVELRDVELKALVEQACEPAAAQAAAVGMQLDTPPPTPPLRVRADARRLRQCLDNLLSNAIKYAGDGRCIEVEVEARGKEVALAVQDHGCGLSEDQLAHLFEPYNRLGRAGGSIPGTGLGLTLTRDLVQAMGGRLEVHSQVGRGCRFEILLAACQPTDTQD